MSHTMNQHDELARKNDRFMTDLDAGMVDITDMSDSDLSDLLGYSEPDYAVVRFQSVGPDVSRNGEAVREHVATFDCEDRLHLWEQVGELFPRDEYRLLTSTPDRGAYMDTNGNLTIVDVVKYISGVDC